MLAISTIVVLDFLKMVLSEIKMTISRQTPRSTIIKQWFLGKYRYPATDHSGTSGIIHYTPLLNNNSCLEQPYKWHKHLKTIMLDMALDSTVRVRPMARNACSIPQVKYSNGSFGSGRNAGTWTLPGDTTAQRLFPMPDRKTYRWDFVDPQSNKSNR